MAGDGQDVVVGGTLEGDNKLEMSLMELVFLYFYVIFLIFKKPVFLEKIF